MDTVNVVKTLWSYFDIKDGQELASYTLVIAILLFDQFIEQLFDWLALIRNPLLFEVASFPKQIVKPNVFYDELVGVVIIFHQPAVTPPSVAGLVPKQIPAPFTYRAILKPALLSFKLLLIYTTELNQFANNAVLLLTPLGSYGYISLVRTSLNGIVSQLQFVY
ncbi:MAG: hypothetical protein EZS28_024287 [Streblomastix strix]|uniref:Uncharacterized protein n=1 Tax=Streblomastix strix TaxID=222440 RepID=A0A5J4VCJ3_9EUKA|nr:MAG: hypothetical protein EZS28_024287 [Streblomastix strix]